MGLLGRDLFSSLLTALLLTVVILFPFALFTWLAEVELRQGEGLYLLLLALPILLLFILKARRPRRTVASLLLWVGIAREQQANSPFKRLRRSLVLILLLAALACLGYGLARPVVQADVAREATQLAVVIDLSASMLSRDGAEGTRFATARAAAVDLVRSLGPADRGMVVAADRRAWIVVPWTDDRGALVDGLESLSARQTSGRLDQALLLAASALTSTAGFELHLFSDGGGLERARRLQLPGELHYHRVGSRSDNVGITSVDIQPRVGSMDEGAGDDSEGISYEVFANVLNASQESREVFLSLEREGRLLAARRLRLEPRPELPLPVVLDARLTPGPLTVRLLPAEGPEVTDVLPEDDLAYLIVPETHGVQVGLVTARDSPALERALEAGGARLSRVNPSEFEDDPRVRLYVFEEFAPALLPPRDCLLINPPRDVGPIRLGPAVERPVMEGWDRDDPYLAYADLSGVVLQSARRLELGPGARALVQGEDPQTQEPIVLVAMYSEGSLDRVVLGFDIYRSTWPLRASFPIFVRNCLWRALGRERLTRGGLQTGSPVSLSAALESEGLVVTTPSGRVHHLPARGGQAEFVLTHEIGLYTVSGGARQEQFCVNLNSPEESRVAPLDSVALGEGLVGPEDRDTQRPVEVGEKFALVALLLLLLEAWAYHRRW